MRPVPQSFRLSGSQCAVPFSQALREEVRSRTGSDAETSGILRSIDRFGGDSVWAYEITPKARRGTRHATRAVTWNVHAIRR